MIKSILRKFGLAGVLFVCSLAAGGIIAWQLISHALADKRDEMLFSLHLRAESLAWAAEGVSRYLGDDNTDFSRMLAELCHQPGIAWIAVIDSSGRILTDSNPELQGSLLYTPAELGALATCQGLQGRFSPDNPQIYETWKLFRPGRLKHDGLHGPKEQRDIIFVALDAGNFKQDLDAYRDHLWLMAALIFLIFAASAALLYFVRNCRISRRRLLDAKALSAQVVSSYPSPMLITDLSGQILLANTPAAQILGRIDGKIQNLPGLDWNGILSELAPNKPILSRELDLIGKNGLPAPINLSGAVITDAAGQAAGYLIAIGDLAEIKRIERKLAEAERVSAMGNLAAGIAHEIRNPLSSICGYAAYLKHRLGDDPMGQTTAALLDEEAQRLNSALCDLLNLVKKPKLNVRPLCIGELLGKIRSLVKADTDAKNIAIKVAFPESAPQPLYADRDKLLQALLNLALNAVQSISENGQVKLSAQFVFKHDKKLPAGINAEKGVWQITVADNGPGMPASILRQIFTPYFTTRTNGTGLGLTLTKQIIEAHRGIIAVASAPGHGAAFTVFLPAEPLNNE